MDVLTPDQRVVISVAIVILAGVLGTVHVVRSIWLKFHVNELLIKMYITFIVVAVLAVLALAGVITGEALVALLGSIVGYVLGSKEKEKDS